MKRLLKKSCSIILGLALMVSSFGSVVSAAANANPSWSVDERVIFHGECKPYDYYAAKDPTIVDMTVNGLYITLVQIKVADGRCVLRPQAQLQD